MTQRWHTWQQEQQALMHKQLQDCQKQVQCSIGRVKRTCLGSFRFLSKELLFPEADLAQMHGQHVVLLAHNTHLQCYN